MIDRDKASQPRPPKRKKTLKCPTCKKPVTEESKAFPFCSERCRMVDLNRWFGEQYTISRPLEMRDLEEGVD